MKKIFFTVLFVLTSFMLFAQSIPAGLQYSAGARDITITGYTGNATTLAIPATIEGLPVTRIGQAAFANDTPRGKPRGIFSVALFTGSVVRKEIYYTVWFNTKDHKVLCTSNCGSQLVDTAAGVLNQTLE